MLGWLFTMMTGRRFTQGWVVDYNEVEGGHSQGWMVAYNEVQVSLKAGWLLTMR